MKKRILAFVLSAVMLMGETLPVMAQNDTDWATDEVVVESEGETSEETEVIAEEGSDVLVEEFTDGTETAAEADAEAVAEEAATAADFIEVTEPDENGISTARVAVSAEDADALIAGTEAAAGTEKSYNINGGSVTIDGTTYTLNAKIEYFDAVYYRGRKIKPVEDLGAKIVSSSLYEAAKQITGMNVPSDLFTWKIKANSKKNAGQDTFLTVKCSVSKSVAKDYSIKGKALKKVKKLAKAFSKEAKKDKITFMIKPIDVAMLLPNNIEIYTYYSGWIVMSLKTWYLRAKIDPLKPNKWKKLSKKEFIITKKKEGGKLHLTFTPKGKNFTGMTLTADVALSRF